MRLWCWLCRKPFQTRLYAAICPPCRESEPCSLPFAWAICWVGEERAHRCVEVER